MRFWKFLAILAWATGCGQTLEKDRTNYLTLRREYQTVRTYSCEGQMESEKKREITEPSTWVRIQPTKTDPTWVAYSSFKVLNTNDSTGMISNLFTFYIHTADTVLGYRVTPGKNQVKYSYWGCRSWSQKRDSHGRAICDQKGSLLETGIVELDVAFEENTRDEIADLKPDSSICQSRSARRETSISSGTR